MLAMKIRPLGAGCIFGLAMFIPAIPYFVSHGVGNLVVVGLVVGTAMGVGIAFALGATAAGRPHSVKSLALALGVCWSFFSSLSWFANQHLADVPWFPWQATMFWAIQALFALLVGWRFAPRKLESVTG